MGLGLRRLAAAGAVLAAVAVLGTRTTATAVDSPSPWTVAVGAPSLTLYPGTAAAVPYDVHNSRSDTRHLQGTVVVVKGDGVGVYDADTGRYVDGCLVGWFQVRSNDVPTGLDVPNGASVHGTAVVAFNDSGASQNACRAIALDVVVTAT